MDAGAGAFPAGKKPGNVRLPVKVGRDSTHYVMRRGRYRYALLQNVNAIFHARLINGREAFGGVLYAGCIKIYKGRPADLHLYLHCPRNYVSRRKLGAFVVSGHEPLALAVEECSARSPHSLGYHEARKALLAKHGWMELDEFYV